MAAHKDVLEFALPTHATGWDPEEGFSWDETGCRTVYSWLGFKIAVRPGAPFSNFGPTLEANRSVQKLVEQMLHHWSGSWRDLSDSSAPHEAGRLHLQIDKAHHQLGWKPRWSFAPTVERTVMWYQNVLKGESPMACCLEDLNAYARE